MKIQVKVTQDHIDRGIRGDGYSCMVALAIKDALPDSEDIEVDAPWVNLQLGDTGYCAKNPGDVQRAIERFDDHQEVEPFEFDLEFTAHDSDDSDDSDDGDPEAP